MINVLASTSILKEECFDELCLQKTNATYMYHLLYSAIRWSLVRYQENIKIVAQRYLNNRKEISREAVSFLHLTRVELHVLLS